MYKIGLKLWSINTDYYYDEAIRLFDEGVFDYIELYVVPDTTDTLKKWKNLKIPFAIHAPHFVHGLNFSDSAKRTYNNVLVEQTRHFSDELEAKYTVFHPGIGGTINETIYQLKNIKNFNFLIENKPSIVNITRLQKDDFCIGSTYEHIKTILTEIDCGFCLDIGHAIAAANYQHIDIYKYLNKMNLFKPFTYHISDIDINSIYDQHLHFGDGSLDFSKIKNLFNINSHIAIETNKDSKFNLQDYRQDSKYIKGIYEKK